MSEEKILYDMMTTAKVNYLAFKRDKNLTELSKFKEGKAPNPNYFGYDRELTTDDTGEDAIQSIDKKQEIDTITKELKDLLNLDTNPGRTKATKVDNYVQYLSTNNNLTELTKIKNAQDPWQAAAQLLRSNIASIKNVDRLNQQLQKSNRELQEKEARYIPIAEVETMFRQNMRSINDAAIQQTRENPDDFELFVSDLAEIEAELDKSLLPELKILYSKTISLRNEINVILNQRI